MRGGRWWKRTWRYGLYRLIRCVNHPIIKKKKKKKSFLIVCGQLLILILDFRRSPVSGVTVTYDHNFKPLCMGQYS